MPVGTLGVDLVGHDGGSAQGEFAYTLLATDRCTQWTELRAVPNKAQKWVFEQLLVVRLLLPFELLGVHSDNGGEFINAPSAALLQAAPDRLHALPRVSQERQQLH